MNRRLGSRIRSTLLGMAAAVLLASALSGPAAGLTLDARAAADAAARAVRASGRVAQASPERGPGGARLTRVVLEDDSGHETARFLVPGGREGRFQWVAEGAPVFVVGERVDVALSPSPIGPTVLELPGGPEAVRRLAPAPGGTSGEAYSRAADAGVAASSTVQDLVPSIGGAVPDDPTLVTVKGSGFGATQADSRVTFQGIFERVDAPVISWTDQQIVCRVPAPGLKGSPQVLSGPIKVWTASGGWSDGDPFTGGARFSVLYQWAGDFWRPAHLPIAIYVNPGASMFGAALGGLVIDASSQWNVPGSYARLEYRGLTQAVGGSHGDPATPPDGRNTVVWRDTWGYQPAILAITWSSIDTLTLEREEVEMEINGTREWTLDPEGEPNKFDLVSTLTHEFGHWLRLGHTQSVPSVMSAFISPGDRRRQISVADAFGASWIHPSYGVASVPDSISTGAALTFPVTAFDREGKPLAAASRGGIEARAIALIPAAVLPGVLDSAMIASPVADAHADRDADLEGHTAMTLPGLPDGLYRIETFVESRLVRPAAIVRVGPAPRAPVLAFALSAVSPQPLLPGTRARVRFTLPARAEIRLDLFDARGRRVREVAAGNFASGGHDVALETVGADGRELSSGVYFLRLAATGGASFPPFTSRVVVLR
ncbi:MAG: matrixin family metalloprotease [Candidatus Eisenbacteria bacterium]